MSDRDELTFGFEGHDLGGLLDDQELDRLLIELDELGVDVDLDLDTGGVTSAQPSRSGSALLGDVGAHRDPEVARLTDLSRSPRPSIDLAPQWIDPSDMPFTPQPRP